MPQSLYRALVFPLFAACLALLSGCIPAPFTGPVPDGMTLLPLPLFDKHAPAAWHPSGKYFSTGKNGLSHYDLSSGQSLLVDRDQPDQIVWSPDGTRLATSYRQEETTQIILREANGQPLAETVLPGISDALLWSKDAGLLAITFRLKTYSFGGDLTLELSRWDGVTPAQTTVLYNNTLKPSTTRLWREGAIAKSQARLSIEQDELLYLQLHAPPAFQEKYQLTLRHLTTGAEKSIAALPIGRRSTAFIEADRILVDNGQLGSVERLLWSDEPAREHPFAGDILAVSPAGRYWLIGDNLLLDKKIIGSFPGVTAATFSPDGKRLLLNINGGWHILDGLNESAPPSLSSAQLEKLRQLRNWRSRDLITPQEYQDQKTRIMNR